MRRWYKLNERFNKWKFCIFIIISFINPASSQTAGKWVEKGLAYYKQGDFNKAIEAFNKAIAIDSKIKKHGLAKDRHLLC